MLTLDSPPKRPYELGGGRRHIVIAEDNVITRRKIEMLLVRLDWTFESTGDGIAALSAIERAIPKPDLVLSDIQMPKMTGLELVKSMRSLPSLAGVPLILMSSPEDEPVALAAGCSGFLAKPFSVIDLLEALNL